MAVPPLPKKRTDRTTKPRSTWRSSGSRFTASSSSFGGFTVERPPVILEFASNILRVGHAEQHRPQHVIAWETCPSSCSEQEEWYLVLYPLLSKVWKDRLMLDPSSRRVVCVTDTMIPTTAWEAAMKQVLWDLGVPAITFVNCLETVPYAMGWQRGGLVVHVGMNEVQCLAVANGHALLDTYQAVPCGYEIVVPSGENGISTVETKWNANMDKYWLNQDNPNGLMMALLKCLSACPTDDKKDIASNIIFVGDACILVPDLSRRVRNRLVALLSSDGTMSFDDEPVISDLTTVPIQWSTLAPLASSVAVATTAPLRPDLMSWIGASVWATVWHRHDDEQDQNVKWTMAPEG